jgi:hypothetical protein
MNRTPRNQLLLQRIPEANPFKATLAPAFFGVGSAFDRDMEEIAKDRRSPEFRREKMNERRQEALGKLLDLQKPIDEYRKQSESMRAGIKTPSYDKADHYAAALRRELRDRSVGMSFGQKAALMSGPTRDPNFVDAVLEQAAWVSGFNTHNPNEAELYETARQSRLRDLNGPLMDALEARGNTEAEIAMVINIVTNDVKGDASYEAEIQATRDRFVADATA